MTGLGIRVVKVSIPPTLFSNGGHMTDHVGITSLTNLGLDIKVSGWGVWGCSFVEEHAFPNAGLVYAERSAREICFLFGMFDATNCDFTVKFRMDEDIKQLYRRFYLDDRKISRLIELTSGNDTVKRGLIGINALIYLVNEMVKEKRLVVKPTRLTV